MNQNQSMIYEVYFLRQMEALVVILEVLLCLRVPGHTMNIKSNYIQPYLK